MKKENNEIKLQNMIAKSNAIEVLDTEENENTQNFITENKIDVSQLSETPNIVLGMNGKKGFRACTQCGILESETLKTNDKYSFCKGICVYCYNKNRTLQKGTSLNKTQLEEKINKLKAELIHYEKLLINFQEVV